MAIRYRKQYKTWQVYWRNPFTGSQECKSFQTKAEAEKENSLVAYRLKYEPESFRKEEEKTEVDETSRTLEQVYIEYLTEKQFSKKHTGCHQVRMRYPLLAFGKKPVDEITQADLESVKTYYLTHSTNSLATIHDKLAALRTVMYYAARKGYRGPVTFPAIPGAHYKKFVPPTPEELSALFDVALPHIQRVIILGGYMGVRIGQCELFQLTWNDVDFRQCVLRIHGSKKNANAPWREVPIRENLIPIFEAWRAEDMATGAEYLVNYNGHAVRSIRKSWLSALKKAGITRHIRPYDLRHAFGTQLVAAGVDIGTVAHLMGHSNPTMLLTHYQYVMNSQKRNAVESLPNLSCMARLYGAKKGLTTE